MNTPADRASLAEKVVESTCDAVQSCAQSATKSLEQTILELEVLEAMAVAVQGKVNTLVKEWDSPRMRRASEAATNFVIALKELERLGIKGFSLRVSK